MRLAHRTFVVLALLVGACEACSWANGYFHQVTAVRGRIVGSSWLGIRWLRQSVTVTDATLTLYEYRLPPWTKQRRRVAVVNTDKYGNFDFGSIPKGHYSLDIEVKDSDRMGGWFDVEVTDSVKATKIVTIDVSPVSPDCKGGHEFIETKS